MIPRPEFKATHINKKTKGEYMALFTSYDANSPQDIHVVYMQKDGTTFHRSLAEFKTKFISIDPD